MCYLAVFAFPALQQWDVWQDFDSPMFAHFDDFAPGFMVRADILCNLFRLFALCGVETRLLVHPSGFNDHNQGFARFIPFRFRVLQVFKQQRE